MTICLLAAVFGGKAQNLYDANRAAGGDLSGTARFVGMGGAMGALGGDLSTISTNPAGIGIYRSNDLAMTLAMNNHKAESNYMGNIMKEHRNRMSFDQLGFVYSTKIGDYTSLRYVNFAFNYHKGKNFNRLFSMGGMLDGHSQSWQMANELKDDNITENELNGIFKSNAPFDNNFGILPIMGIRTGLVSCEEMNDGNIDVVGWEGNSNNFFSDEKGGIQQYDFNMALNLNDRLYLGFTLGVYDLDYDSYTSYTENLDGYQNAEGLIFATGREGDKLVANGGYTLENFYKLEGTGVDLKLGAILRPIEDSPLRFGMAIHTPTWYDVTESYNSKISSDITSYGEQYSILLSDYLGEDYRNYDYKIRTPWKFNLSAGTTISNIMAIGAEYEYADFSSCRLQDMDYNNLGDQVSVDKFLRGVSTFRLGAESRIDRLSIRAGYNFQTSPFKKEAYNALAPHSTNTSYTNYKDKQTFTFGLGYRGKTVYADLAWKYEQYDADFLPFEDGMLNEEFMPFTKVENNRQQLMMTIGARF